MERNNYNRGGGGGRVRGGGRGGVAGRGDGRGGNYHQQQGQNQSGGGRGFQNQSGGGRGFRPDQGYGGPQRPPVGHGGNNGAWGQNRPIQTASNFPPAQPWGPRLVQGEGGANRLPASSAGAYNLPLAQQWGPRPVQGQDGGNRIPAPPETRPPAQTDLPLPVSLVPPVYYADLVAYRGRLYNDAAMELQSRGSTTSSSSKSATSFDKKFFEVHPNLQDSMFFV